MKTLFQNPIGNLNTFPQCDMQFIYYCKPYENNFCDNSSLSFLCKYLSLVIRKF